MRLPFRVKTVYAGDVGMVQRGQGLGLALEAREAGGIPADAGGQHLDRDLAAELGVRRAIHFPHAAFAELGGDPVMSDPGIEIHLLEQRIVDRISVTKELERGDLNLWANGYA